MYHTRARCHLVRTAQKIPGDPPARAARALGIDGSVDCTFVRPTIVLMGADVSRLAEFSQQKSPSALEQSAAKANKAVARQRQRRPVIFNRVVCAIIDCGHRQHKSAARVS